MTERNDAFLQVAEKWKPVLYTREVSVSGSGETMKKGEIVSGDIVDTPGIDGSGDPIPMTLKAVQKHI